MILNLILEDDDTLSFFIQDQNKEKLGVVIHWDARERSFSTVIVGEDGRDINKNVEYLWDDCI